MVKKIFLSFLLIICIVSTFFGVISAQELPASFRVLCNIIHKQVATIGTGGDIITSWLNQTGVKEIEWQTLANVPLHERFFRESTLKETDVDVFYLLNSYAMPGVINMLDPLDDYLKSDPIEGFPEDFSQGMIDAITFNGKLYGIPVRHSTSAFHYNEALFEERGLEGPPKTIEEFFDYAVKLTYTRPDGSQVIGFSIDWKYSIGNIVDLSRAWNADFITTDYKVVCNEPPMVKAMTMFRDLYLAGAFPKIRIEGAENDRWMQTGRAAMGMAGIGRTVLYNDPNQGSQFPGKFKVAGIPVSKELTGYEIAPSKTEVWYMTIPKNSKHKDLAWNFIKHLSTTESAIAMALNGNGPARLSTYDDPTYKSLVYYAELEKNILEIARVPLPGFEKSAEATDKIFEAFEEVLFGVKTPQQSMDDLAKELERLLKESGINI